MKKIISTVLVCVLLLGCVFTLASCDKVITGSYKAGATTINFKLNKVEIVDEVEILGKVSSTTYEAKYKVTEEDGKYYITFTYEDGADKHLILNGKLALERGEKDGTKYVQIGIITYNKI